MFSKSTNEEVDEKPKDLSSDNKSSESSLFLKMRELWDIDDYTRKVLEDLVDWSKNGGGDGNNKSIKSTVAAEKVGLIKEKKTTDKSISDILGSLDGDVRTFLSDIAGRAKIIQGGRDRTRSIPSPKLMNKPDILDIIPSSVMDDKSKGTLRVLSSLGDKLLSQFQKSTEKMQHPFLINTGILRLYAMQSTPSIRPSLLQRRALGPAERAASLQFLAEARYFLRCASDVYGESLYVAAEDVVLDCLQAGSRDGENVMIPRHIVFVDHLTRSVVISIRGTGSVSDVLTDLQIDAKPLYNKGSTLGGMLGRLAGAGVGGNDVAGEVVFAHSGMTDSALALQPSVTEAIHDALDKYKGYGVVFTGHSLGAGTACLLSTLISREEDIAVKTYAFAPPPVISRGGANDFRASEFLSGKGSGKCAIFSFVNDNDVVTRSSHNEFLNMLSTITCIDSLPWSPKERTMKIMQGYLTDDEMSMIDNAVKDKSSGFHDHDGVELVIPGDIFWLIPKASDSKILTTGSESEKTLSEKYEMVTIRDPNILFNGPIMMGDSMVTDHMVTSYMNSMINLDTSSTCEID
jgi:hypothetical protein